MSESQHRQIRSFVKREGRMTAAQTRALDELMPVYGILYSHNIINTKQLFENPQPVYVEIGFGMGRSLLEMAAAHPERNYIGIEVHRPGVGSLLSRMEQQGIGNLRVINHDAVEVMRDMFADDSLDGLYLFFPDPWPKKKHHKRRILQTAFIDVIWQKLKPGACFHMATDWQDYAEQMMETMSAEKGFLNQAGDQQYAERGERPLTKYEQRGRRLGHGVWDLIFCKQTEN